MTRSFRCGRIALAMLAASLLLVSGEPAGLAWALPGVSSLADASAATPRKKSRRTTTKRTTAKRTKKAAPSKARRAAAPPPPASLSEAIERAVQIRSLAKAVVGVHIVDVEDGEVMYARHEDRLFSVASNNKVFTTAAALSLLGPDYDFRTHVSLRGTIDAAGTLAGDLKIVGSGDPAMSSRFFEGVSTAVFQGWAKALQQAGVRRIQGAVMLDTGAFDQQWVHPTWPEDQLLRWYEAPVGGLALEESMVRIRVAAARSGGRAVVTTEPPLPEYMIENSCVTGRGKGVSIRRLPGSNRIAVTGSIASGAREIALTVHDPVDFFGQALLETLRLSGIASSGRLVRVSGDRSEGWKPLAMHRSSLVEIVGVINKRSHNFYADQLIKTLGAEIAQEGSFRAGAAEVAKFVAEAGIEPSSVVVVDGSGMSRGNRATPRAFTGVLRHMFQGRLQKDFIASLPYSGEPGGRLRRRLNYPPYLRNVYAKTGTIEGVTTLSGYVKARSGKIYAFSLLFNGVPGAWAGVGAQDEILRALIDRG